MKYGSNAAAAFTFLTLMEVPGSIWTFILGALLAIAPLIILFF